MPRRLTNAISPPEVKSLGAGKHADGGGLYLIVKPRANPREGEPKFNRSWLFVYRSGGKPREMGLGPAQGKAKDADKEWLTLATARDKARDFRVEVKAGGDPLNRIAAEKAAKLAAAQASVVAGKTFREVAKQCIEAREAEWRNAKHAAQWTATLTTYAFPHFGDIAVKDVTTAHVLAALEPIWTTKTETASRVRGRIEAVLDYARAREWRTGENPARWRGHMKELLASPKKAAKTKHHAAMPWPEVGAFMVNLRARSATAARALEFTILTTVRTSNALEAKWSEMDRAKAIWTIPGDQMKGEREHRVSLSAPAVAILDEMEKLRPETDRGDAYVFPGQKPGRPLSSMAMLMLLRRMGYPVGDLTVHGYRSTFKDWAAESTAYPNEVTEMALAHAVDDKVEAAYRRGDLLEKRRRLMEDWAIFCAQPMVVADNVTPIRAVAAV